VILVLPVLRVKKVMRVRWDLREQSALLVPRVTLVLPVLKARKVISVPLDLLVLPVPRARKATQDRLDLRALWVQSDLRVCREKEAKKVMPDPSGRKEK
jgi:hypothetical protein